MHRAATQRDADGSGVGCRTTAAIFDLPPITPRGGIIAGWDGNGHMQPEAIIITSGGVYLGATAARHRPDPRGKHDCIPTRVQNLYPGGALAWIKEAEIQCFARVGCRNLAQIKDLRGAREIEVDTHIPPAPDTRPIGRGAT